MGLLDTILSALGLRKQPPDTSIDHATVARAAEAVASDDSDDGADDDDDDSDDGEDRDYELEARDDQASFKFDSDIEHFFEARYRIEHHWDDEDQRESLFQKYEIRNTQHWYQVRATYERWAESPATMAKYGSQGDLMQVQMAVIQRVANDVMGIGNQHEALAADLAPVEGVTLEQWAKVQANAASGTDIAPMIAELGVDRAAWDRVSAEWNARMSRDASFTITTEYAKHFQNAGVGQFAGAAASSAAGAALTEADAPITLERYVEIEIAQSSGVEQGKDAATILKGFGMNAVEWGQVGGWWGMFIGQNAMKNDGELHKRYTRAREQFEAKYKTASADDDLSF